ncbi:porin [Brachymonas denitrificans]|uniref:porin n=1 Tax=Brachymonas denitrificans TaxID=28220 RepID=UPI001BCBB9E2|nr:porin [Brachymonas denitrificans]
MKKSLIAIAALAAVGAASAQSSVTMYGLADVNLGYSKDTVTVTTPNGSGKLTNRKTGFQSGGLQGSRLGVKGVEDLGNGLKAVFNYELGFDAINGAFTDNSKDGIGFSRRAVVGLQGGFGSVLFGKDYTPLYNLITATSADGQSSFDAGALTTGAPNLGGLGGAAAKTYKLGGYKERAYGVHYAGNFSGVGVQAFGEYSNSKTELAVTGQQTNVLANTKSQGYGLGVSYANGPFMVGVAGHQVKNTAMGTTVSKITEYGVGGTYDFGAAKLFANYLYSKNRPNAALAATPLNANVNTKAEEANIGVLVPFGAASLVAEYGHNRVKFYDGVSGEQMAKGKGNDWMIGANYAFSKRTDVYARVGRSNDLKVEGVNGYFDDITARAKTEKAAIGLRHKF